MGIGDARLGISCGSVDAGRAVREAFRAVLVEMEAPLGFTITVPTGRNRFYVLTDRCGFVMGRSKRLDEIVSMLAGLLSSFSAQPSGTQRLGIRVLARGTSAFLCVPPVLFTEPPIERRLQRSDLAVVDRLVVDLAVDGMALTVQPVPQFVAGIGEPGIGHLSPGAHEPLQVHRVLVPAGAGGAQMSRANVVAAIAGSAVGGSRAHSLSLACAIETRGVDHVPLVDGSLKAVLERL